VFVTIGQTKGKTLLPLPPAEGGSDPARDKERIHVLESAVVTWTRQIKNVLKTDPEAVLKHGEHPGPLVEVEFWAAKAQNLNSIYEQLSGPHIRKVGGPHHHPPFFPNLCLSRGGQWAYGPRQRSRAAL